MLEVILRGHDNYYGVADILRLFYDGIREEREVCRVIAPNGPDISIISSVEEGGVRAFCGDVSIRLDNSNIPVKRDIKRSLYKLLEKLTSQSFPWGCLTGIRPTLVAAECSTPDEMTEIYFVRPDKSDLAFRTYREEQALLATVPQDSLNIYIGVPFCPSRCEYCSFVAADISHHMGLLDDYESALIKELELIAPRIDRKLASVYMGGGTPTVFSNQAMDRLIKTIRDLLPMDEDTEFTVEAGRPDTLSENKLRSMMEAGVGRLCINPQTMRDETLLRLNRRHSVSDVVRAYQKARELGFTMINMDLIAGLKYEPSEAVLDSLEQIFELSPANITIHTLYKKRRAAMGRQDVLDRDGSRGDIDAALREAYSMLGSKGYDPYYMYRQKDTGHGLENVGFALPGTGCRYNVAMMSDRRDVLSFGAGGMSKRIFDNNRLERCSTVKDVIAYIRDPAAVAAKKLRFYELDGIQ